MSRIYSKIVSVFILVLIVFIPIYLIRNSFNESYSTSGIETSRAVIETHDSKEQIILNEKQFKTIIQHCISLLNTHQVREIVSEEHVIIIKSINTINKSRHILSKNDSYEVFMKLVAEKKYEIELSSFFDWTPNKGMGYYFPSLQVELGGSPAPNSYYEILG